MIRLLPGKSETLVVVLPGDEVRRRMAGSTTSKLRTQNQVKDKRIVFTGTVTDNRFSISLKITRPNSFIPLVDGQIESTSAGAIVFMRFALFPGTRAYLIFWLSFVLIASAVVAAQYESALPLLAGAVINTVVLWIAWANFGIQVRFTRKAIEKVLSP